MIRAPRRLTLVLLALALSAATLAGTVSSALALVRTIRVTGTSSGAGTCNITIESFGSLLVAKGGNHTETSYLAVTSVPGGSTASATATTMRNDIDAVLPAEFVVTLSAPDIVSISRTNGFMVTIDNHIPSQLVADTTNVPGSGPLAQTGLGLLLAAIGILAFRRRRVT